MYDVFFYLLAIGAIVLIVQIVLSLTGLVGGVELGGDDAGGATGALNLLSVRALSAGAVGFGATGLVLLPWLPAVAAAGAALAGGVAAAGLTAYLTRLLFGLESRGNLRLDEASGQRGTVYLPVPGSNQGTGLVHFTLQGRTVELRAFTRDDAPLATGAAVLVISVDPETETAEVIATSNIEGFE